MSTIVLCHGTSDKVVVPEFGKACCFNDSETAEKILKTSDESEIKAFGRAVTGYNESVWNGIRQIVVYEGLKAKFSQN